MAPTRGVGYADAVTSPFPLHRYTLEDYAELEDGSPIKHEFLDGEIVALAGGTPEHAAMAAFVIRSLGNQLEGSPCRVFSSDLGVRVLDTSLSTYPDVSVICGLSARDPKKATNVTNPKLLVEVTSDGTEDYDRGEKLQQYQRIPSLDTVVIVSHRQPRIDVWSRVGSDWSHVSYTDGQSAVLTSIACTLGVSAVFQAGQEPSTGV
jgi:Uma2 family endonuclease